MSAAIWEAIYAAGQKHGMVEYGTETMHVPCAPRRVTSSSVKTRRTVTPDDAGLTWAIGKAKKGFRRQTLARTRVDEACESQQLWTAHAE